MCKKQLCSAVAMQLLGCEARLPASSYALQHVHVLSRGVVFLGVHTVLGICHRDSSVAALLVG
jgi:hypothetical protein